MESTQLLALFKRGLIPGPVETEDAFEKRVGSHLSLLSTEWKEVAAPMMDRCGFSIDWVPIIYSYKKLLPWEGAIFWVDDRGQSFLQLRPSLQEAQKIWGNSRQEVLMHEAIHAAREAFNEPTFEEFLAYSISCTYWKRWLGPFFVRPWEFPLIALTLFLLPMIPWIATLVFILFGSRFFFRASLFHRLKKTIPFPILLCLTDREMKQRANFKENIISKEAVSLRQQLIEVLQKEYGLS